MNVIQCTNLRKSYGKIQAVADLNVEIEENKITGLIGRNGAGKTTLLKLIAGHLRPTSGELRVFARAPFNNLVVAANLFFMDDTLTFPDSFTLGDIFIQLSPFYPNWHNSLAHDLFNFYNLNPQQPHSNLSKGSKSAFNSILAIASRCPLTLFDEPTTGMDSAVRKAFYRFLLRDYLEYPRTILLSSHLLSEIEEILEDILLLDNGKMLLHLPVLELKELAVGIRGNASVAHSFLQGLEIIYEENFAKDAYIVLRKALIQDRLAQIQQSGLEVLPVSTDDLCIYLTAKTKGGI